MNLLISIPPFLTLCCFLGLAVLTVIQGRRTKINILFFITCILGSFLYIDILFAFNRLYAEIVFPMIFEKRLSGFIVLGEKLSGDLFTPEDMDLLETLASQCALAVEGKKGLILLATRFDNDTRHVVFECEDNGPGISKSHRQDIFKPFFTTKEPGKGTGLGLYICHEIIRKHGGIITVENSEKQGAKFVISLPAMD